MFLRLVVLGFALAAAAANAASVADQYPQRPVRVLLPFAPGGNTDIVARLIGPKLHALLGQPFVMDNRPGASGNIAVQLVVNAQPDGLTLLLGNVATNSINPILFSSKLGFDSSKELTGITLLTSTPHALVTGAQFPANTLKEFLAIARARPGELNHSATVGNQSHLVFLQLFKAANVKLIHVPTKGGAGTSITPLISGEIQISHVNVGTIGGLVKQGRLKAFAVTTGERVPDFPDVPTLAEVGFPGITADNWTGLFAPVRTPRPIVQKLHRSLVKIMEEQEVRDLLAAKSTTVKLSKSPEDFEAFVKVERAKWAKTIQDNNIKID